MSNPFYVGHGGPMYLMGGVPQQMPMMQQGGQMPFMAPPQSVTAAKAPPQLTEEKLQEKGIVLFSSTLCPAWFISSIPIY